MFGGLRNRLSELFGLTKKEPEKKSGVYGAAAIAQAFKGASFPMSKEDILEKYGDRKVQYHVGKKEHLRDVIENIPDETFNSTVDLEHALHETLKKRK
ncbi:MAG: hypothetical protein A2287_03820 [Candidatus Melainabacteria bacterium RIFOXYA12_FULL_32_12]|nr:MAG: hypothetical protein A2104_05960 [Candidatus Melainabacteria bacterium GWF2_32_7]OGI21152.1 MAG: hypothetical protein A2255_00800 [Candidatus Melainabacteria bacterium RIFOXYA2_FULL_32_9]OGI28835.1 MAG: hypothetical protein A2287_03820 [Candidatus Melainabacteria bacterium RIFOXYA12_FULL_32_12]